MYSTWVPGWIWEARAWWRSSIVGVWPDGIKLWSGSISVG
jgi:hypothetical protein